MSIRANEPGSLNPGVGSGLKPRRRPLGAMSDGTPWDGVKRGTAAGEREHVNMLRSREDSPYKRAIRNP